MLPLSIASYCHGEGGARSDRAQRWTWRVCWMLLLLVRLLMNDEWELMGMSLEWALQIGFSKIAAKRQLNTTMVII
jgi:hypothetical protein